MADDIVVIGSDNPEWLAWWLNQWAEGKTQAPVLDVIARSRVRDAADELTRLRARVAELEAQVAGQQRVMENAIATLRKSLARRPSAAIHEVVFTLTAFLRSRSQP